MKTKTTPRRLARALGTVTVFGLVCTAAAPSVLADRAAVVEDAIWVHDELYGTIGTDTTFSSPPPHSTDVIFSFGDSGLEGQRSIAEYAPGEPEYNGGRWHVMAVEFTDMGKLVHDADGDGEVNFELTNAEELLMHAEWGHLTISDTGFYFECPLRPRRGR